MLLKNKYHRYLNLPFKLKKPQICNVVPKNLKHYNISSHKDLQLNKFLKQFNLLVANTELFFTPGGEKLPIHIDGPELDDHVKINISYGPSKGTTRWWEAPNIDIKKTLEEQFKNIKPNQTLEGIANTHIKYKSITIEEKDCEMVYEANTNTPSLVNVGTFHSSYNPTNEGRWTLCFILGKENKYLYWDNAIKIFKDYIE